MDSPTPSPPANNQSSSDSAGCLWLIWFIIVIAAPWTLPWVEPLMHRFGDWRLNDLWLAYGIVLASSFVMAGCRVKSQRWSWQWSVETAVGGILLSIMGAAVSAGTNLTVVYVACRYHL